MATQNLQPLEVLSGGFKTRLPEAASQSFKRGELVYLVSGKITVCSSDATTIYGMALQDASGTTDTLLDILVFDQSTILRGNVYHATEASAITAVTNVGVKYAILVSSNKVHVDIGDTSNDAVVILSLDQGELGDTYGRCYFRFLSAVLQGDDTAS